MDVIVMQSPVGGSSKKREKRKRKRERKKQAKSEAQNKNQLHDNSEASEKTTDCKLANDNSENKTDLTVQPLAGNPKLEAVSTETPLEGSGKKKRKKRRKKSKKKTTVEDEAQNIGQANANVRSTQDPTEGNVTGKRKRKKIKKATNHDEAQGIGQLNADEKIKKATNHDEAQGIGQINADSRSEKNLGEGDVSGKRKRKRKKIKKATNHDEAQGIGQIIADAGSEKNLGEGNVSGKRKRKRKKIKKATNHDEAQGIGQTNADAESGKNSGEGNVSGKRKRKRKKTKKAANHDEAQGIGQINADAGSEKKSGEGNVSGKRKKKRKKTRKEECKDVTTHLFSSDVKAVECLCPEQAPVTSFRRKLLILDLNGLLADIVKEPQKQCRGDTRISGRSIYRRPFCDDFLKFCFQNFDVGIWSSRSKIILHKVVDYLLGDLKHKLLFCWDMSHSTQTGVKTLENCHKPLVCKELRKIWENDGPNMCWKKGDYDESNTLLLDDSPYKALLNPLHTAIFPYPYMFGYKNDSLLGPGGDLRVFLEGLIACDDVRKYVEQHPFGQKAINGRDSSWGFYESVINRMSS